MAPNVKKQAYLPYIIFAFIFIIFFLQGFSYNYEGKKNYTVRVLNQNGQKINNAWVNITITYQNSLSFHEPIKYFNLANTNSNIYYIEYEEKYASIQSIELYVFCEGYESFTFKTPSLNSDVTVRLKPKW